ncbi:Transcription factor spt8 [Elasticomyces elasticus]|uniref:Transcription factor spt8 n=1 Tax=Exophiala sideris TaxID=1016849 RepID=A0ABR0JFG9_9EURO|nr:Transcription factor spt8 [Elasticomyces elasticus]KAK5027587.1 Transcription factor spt8 [Exophiala sideris]KAK5032851.1 Transcription factor spt8 [Exophiala sideris]KAK5062375.1 Transcription factor spt8 [Exophiala sideris]KAK5177533.1 Transcription factor spt8 [Eurotiomycetes sp. CCFEE 6388]
MPAFDEDDDRSQDDFDNDNDNDETMQDFDDGDGDGDGDGNGGDQDADVDIDAEPEDGEGEGEGEGEGDGDGDADDDDDAGSQSGGSQNSDNEDASGDPPATQDGLQLSGTQADEAREAAQRANISPEYLDAATYDIVPTIAAPQSTSINAVCATSDMRWVFTGGSDGYIRKFNWVDSVNFKLALTVAQRHPFVDSVVKAGVLMTYWENWDARPQTTQVLAPVYSLACQSQGLWMLSGTSAGPIRLQSIRHDEGREVALLKKHTSAVSVLTLSSDEKSLLSGSWDKSVLDWDLETGQVRTTFASSAVQISAIEARPLSSVPVPAESGEVVVTNGTFSSNEGKPNGIKLDVPSQDTQEPPTVATPDSLFGDGDGDDDLFGDSAGGVMGNGGDLVDAFGEADDEMSRAIANGPQPEELVDHEMADTTQPPAEADPAPDEVVESQAEPVESINGVANTSEPPLVNGLPHADDLEKQEDEQETTQDSQAPPTSDSTFLATSIDGAIRVWDRRQPKPVARILPRNTPPWCLSACWSVDGNCIYAGRRNNTVEEYDLRKGLKAPERIFRFPNGSGAVTSVKAMPNGRHLICASYDILRLYDLRESQAQRSAVPFLIVPGHRTGTVSHLYLDPSCRFMLSSGGNRGWEGASTEVLLGYEIAVPNR